jgi:uncharacterized membrane protein HdeD (DUF308 family)
MTRARGWMLVAGSALLIAGHGYMLSRLSSHAAVPAVVAFGVMIVVGVAHLVARRRRAHQR